MDGPSLLRLALALLVVVGLIFALAALARRTGRLSSLQRQPRIHILETRRLGARGQLCLVRIGQTELLLGVTAQHIHLLHPLSPADANTESNGPQSPDPDSFPARLQALWAKETRP